MIKHIARIANTTREHDLGYGFLLTQVFEYFRVKLQKRIKVQVIDEIGSSTLIGCGFELIQGTVREAEQGAQTPLLLFLVAQPTGLLWKDFSKNSNAYNPS